MYGGQVRSPMGDDARFLDPGIRVRQIARSLDFDRKPAVEPVAGTSRNVSVRDPDGNGWVGFGPAQPRRRRGAPQK